MMGLFRVSINAVGGLLSVFCTKMVGVVRWRSPEMVRSPKGSS
jgi:hypothetical protein